MPASSTELALPSTMTRLFERSLEDWSTDPASSAAAREQWRIHLEQPAREFLDRPGKQFRGRLSHIAWQLGRPDQAPPPEALPWIVEVLHAGSLIVDDVQDRSEQRRGAPTLHRRIGEPLAINLGNFFYCWGLELLSQLDLPARRELDLYRRTVVAMRRCHQGQALDLGVRVHQLEPDEVPALVRSSTELKAGTLLELAAALGAIAAGATPERAQALAEFGSELGVGLQMLDDLSGVLNPRRQNKAVEDLRGARLTWVWAWLAEDLPAGEFRDLQRRLAAVLDGSEPASLIETLGGQVGPSGAARVRRHLETAWVRVERALGPSTILSQLRQEIERLQESYV